MEGACFFWSLPCHLSKSCVLFSKIEAERAWDSDSKKMFAFDQFFKIMVGAVSAADSKSQGTELVRNMLKEEVGSELPQSLWDSSVTEKAVRVMEKLKVDLYIF